MRSFHISYKKMFRSPPQPIWDLTSIDLKFKRYAHKSNKFKNQLASGRSYLFILEERHEHHLPAANQRRRGLSIIKTYHHNPAGLLAKLKRKKFATQLIKRKPGSKQDCLLYLLSRFSYLHPRTSP